jgi:hypothetical protein
LNFGIPGESVVIQRYHREDFLITFSYLNDMLRVLHDPPLVGSPTRSHYGCGASPPTPRTCLPRTSCCHRQVLTCGRQRPLLPRLIWVALGLSHGVSIPISFLCTRFSRSPSRRWSMPGSHCSSSTMRRSSSTTNLLSSIMSSSTSWRLWTGTHCRSPLRVVAQTLTLHRLSAPLLFPSLAEAHALHRCGHIQ